MTIELRKNDPENHEDVLLEYTIDGQEQWSQHFEMFKCFLMALGYTYLADYEMVEIDEYEDDISK